jgi:hypothetical protein
MHLDQRLLGGASRELVTSSFVKERVNRTHKLTFSNCIRGVESENCLAGGQPARRGRRTSCLPAHISGARLKRSYEDAFNGTKLLLKLVIIARLVLRQESNPGPPDLRIVALPLRFELCFPFCAGRNCCHNLSPVRFPT